MDQPQQDYTNRIKSFVQNLKPISGYKQDFEQLCQSSARRISTGWASVDKVLNGGLHPDLYIMAAETSTGKSAFMASMAQNIAKSGISVLYFTLEMTKPEFVARAISSISFIENAKDQNNKKFTTGNILYSTFDESLNEFVQIPFSSYKEYSDKYFEQYGNNLYIIPAPIEGFCAKDIANISSEFRKSISDGRMVVFIDYMQILKPDPDDRSQIDRKTKADRSTMILKTLSSMGMPVITMSSVGRDKYGGKISTNAFKESGDIEYTGGVLLGWNWHGVTDAKNKEVADKEIEDCNKRGYRKMILEVIKFRNSARFNEAKLVYFPAYNYFVDQYDFNVLNFNDENPFMNWEDSDKGNLVSMGIC